MQYTTLGRSGMKISRLVLGTMNFGDKTEEKEAYRIMDRALELGINFFDTANNYCHSETEKIIGRWFAQGNGRREKVILGTKVYDYLGSEAEDGPNAERGLSAYKIRRHLEGSLRRLQTDHIELYQMHHIDRNVSWDELWGALEREVNSGKVDYIGSSNFAGRDLVAASYEAKQRHFLGLISEQHRYSLLQRLPELEVLPAAKEQGIGILVWGPLAGGLLSENALHPADSSRGKDNMSWMGEDLKKQLKRYESLCRELGEKQSDVALAWLLQQENVTAPIMGIRTLEQLESAVHALDIHLEQDFLAELDKIFPGYGPAPEYYAW